MGRSDRRVIFGGVVVLLLSAGCLMFAAPVMALPKAPSSAFQPARECGCHAGLAEQWRVSMHAKAYSDPAFQVKKSEAERAIEGVGAFCDTCHAPVAVMSGELATGKLKPSSADAIGCDFCHQVIGTATPPGNTSQTMKLDGAKRAQLKDAKSPYHETAYSAFHQSAEFCGACHNVNHPVNGMHLEATYSEWKDGPYSKMGIVCQDCHMTPGAGVTKPNPGSTAGGPQREHIYTMTFAGGNVAQGDSARAEERLKGAAELRLSIPATMTAGDTSSVNVTVSNVGAGHYLPTGLTEVRQMWLDVSVEDADGKLVSIGRRDFGTVLKDAKGKFPVELWEAVALHKDDRIPPKGSVKQAYDFKMPEADSAKIVATLNYRSLPPELAEKAEVENPVTEMARAEGVVRLAREGGEGGEPAEPEDDDSTGTGALLPITLVVAVLAVAGIGVVAALRRRRKTA